ncbi:hypothetical protein STENM327S_08334 [Streptomyces tendae]
MVDRVAAVLRAGRLQDLTGDQPLEREGLDADCLGAEVGEDLRGAERWRVTKYRRSRSRTTATPSSSYVVVTSSATALSSGWAPAMATPWAAQWNIGMSLGMSPKAIVRRRSRPRCSAAGARPVALVMPHGCSSTVPGPDMVTVAREPTTARAVAASSSSVSSGRRSSTLLIGLDELLAPPDAHAGGVGGDQVARLDKRQPVDAVLVDGGMHLTHLGLDLAERGLGQLPVQGDRRQHPVRPGVVHLRALPAHRESRAAEPVEQGRARGAGRPVTTRCRAPAPATRASAASDRSETVSPPRSSVPSRSVATSEYAVRSMIREYGHRTRPTHP